MAEPANGLPGRLTGLSTSLRDAMPAALHHELFFGIELWQLLGVVVAGLLAWLLSLVVVALGGVVTRRLAAHTVTRIDDELAVRMIAPARLLILALLVRPLLGVLGLPPPVWGTLNTLARATIVLALFWATLRSVTVAATHLGVSGWATSRPGSKSLIALGGSIGRVAIIAVGVVTVLSELEYPVASIIAGLGLGGLALALAAQKTIENLFGAFSLAVDQPFRVGDFVKVGDFVGTVEEIGMRSTRFRTLDRTLISIPNGKLAEAQLETYAARDRIRLFCTLGLVYGTTAKQLRRVLESVEAALRAHPKIWPDSVLVNFKELGRTSLDVEVMAWFQTSDWNEFLRLRQDVLLQFMELVEEAGTSLAFPTSTVHVVGEPPRAAPSQSKGE